MRNAEAAREMRFPKHGRFVPILSDYTSVNRPDLVACLTSSLYGVGGLVVIALDDGAETGSVLGALVCVCGDLVVGVRRGRAGLGALAALPVLAAMDTDGVGLVSLLLVALLGGTGGECLFSHVNGRLFATGRGV